jgi:hypothetical protein
MKECLRDIKNTNKNVKNQTFSRVGGADKGKESVSATRNGFKACITFIVLRNKWRENANYPTLGTAGTLVVGGI